MNVINARFKAWDLGKVPSLKLGALENSAKFKAWALRK